MNSAIVTGITHQLHKQDATEMFNKLTYTPRPTVDGRYRNENSFKLSWIHGEISKRYWL